MGLQISGLVAARILTHLIPDQQCAPLPLLTERLVRPNAKHLAMLVNDGTQHRVIAGHLLGSGGLDRADSGDVADGLTW